MLRTSVFLVCYSDFVQPVKVRKQLIAVLTLLDLDHVQNTLILTGKIVA